MDEVVAAYPNRRLQVVLDNLNTHKNNDEWLKRHPLVTFHFTPTRASWLNQVECWFSILQGQSLTGASFTSALAIDRVLRPEPPTEQSEPASNRAATSPGSGNGLQAPYDLSSKGGLLLLRVSSRC
jgi:hypothetical protein